MNAFDHFDFRAIFGKVVVAVLDQGARCQIQSILGILLMFCFRPR